MNLVIECANQLWLVGWLDHSTLDDVQKRIIADRQKQAPHEALSRASTQGQPEMVNKPVETDRLAYSKDTEGSKWTLSNPAVADNSLQDS
jgi:hypothetical protein